MSGTKDMLRKTKEEILRGMMKTSQKNTGGEKIEAYKRQTPKIHREKKKLAEY